MKDLKDSYPIKLAYYEMSNRLLDEPVFAWWVPYTPKKRIDIISNIKSKYWKKTHKYGIKVPENVKEAKVTDQENGNKLWEEAMVMEMTNNQVALEHYEGNTSDLVA